MKSLLLCLLLGVALTSPAASYYLLSSERALAKKYHISLPRPLNPHPDAPRYRIVDDIWLVDDSAFVPPAPNAPSVDEVGLLLAARIARAREAARTQAVRDSLNRALLPPPRPPHSNYYNRTTTNLTAVDLATLESIIPGASTNFTPEQLERARRNAKPVISRPAEARDVVPLDPHSPTFKEDFVRWKNGTLTNIPAAK
jgi:hypothetical protein